MNLGDEQPDPLADHLRHMRERKREIEEDLSEAETRVRVVSAALTEVRSLIDYAERPPVKKQVKRKTTTEPTLAEPEPELQD